MEFLFKSLYFRDYILEFIFKSLYFNIINLTSDLVPGWESQVASGSGQSENDKRRGLLNLGMIRIPSHSLQKKIFLNFTQ